MTADNIACAPLSSTLPRHLPFVNEGKRHTSAGISEDVRKEDVRKCRPCFGRAGRHLPGNAEQNANASFRRSDHRSVKVKPAVVFVDKTSEVWVSSKPSLLMCAGISTKVPWQGPTLLSRIAICDDQHQIELGQFAWLNHPGYLTCWAGLTRALRTTTEASTKKEKSRSSGSNQKKLLLVRRWLWESEKT